ncbi:MAG TPA: helix-turn-helix domain-containing protein [Novosphingobium sp.]|nr:helix-turn-helix domain-containing protein [Novosphingobium sp.]
MRNGTPRLSSLARATALFERILADAGSSTVAALARSIDMPVATAHRHAATLVEAGLLRKVGGGRLVAGPLLFSLFRRVDEKQVLALSAAPVIHEVSRRLDGVVQLGTFENDMVTYRLKAGRQARSLFTEVGMQLEAYCSAVGKALLAHLPEGPR